MIRISIAAAVAALVCASACSKKDEKDTETEETHEEAVAPAKGDEEAAGDEDLLERGKYLVETVMNCGVCHTPMGPEGPDMSKRFAGGFEVEEKFGTWRSTNITPHEETGIGNWTDEQIIAAVREGKRPDGSMVAPIMPYMFYNQMSDDDARAMVAYLRTLEPIEHEVERAELEIPSPPAPPPSGKAPDTTDQMAHGAYLAALMKCAHCHTPIGEQGFEVDKMFAGGLPMELPILGEGVLYASNITSDEETGIGSWTHEQIIASITKMQRPDGKPIMGPMVFFGMNWARMEADDLEAVATFIKNIPAIEHEVQASTFKPNGPPPGAAP